MFGFTYLKNSSTLEFYVSLCNGCGTCTEVCPHGVFSLHEGSARVDRRDNCMECGACAVNCPFGALRVESGVGCASGIINGIIGGTEPACGCDDESPCYG